MLEMLLPYKIIFQGLIGVIGILLIIALYRGVTRNERRQHKKERQQAIINTGDEALMELLAQAKTKAEREEILRFAETDLKQNQQASFAPEAEISLPPEEIYSSLSEEAEQGVLEALVKEEAEFSEAMLAEEAMEAENILATIEEVEDNNEIDQNGALTIFSESLEAEAPEYEAEGDLAKMFKSAEKEEAFSETGTIEIVADEDQLSHTLADTIVAPQYFSEE